MKRGKQPPQQEAKIDLIFQGDLVFQQNITSAGFLWYLEQGQAKISIETIFVVAARRLQLLTKREVAPSLGYDLDQLFVEFAQHRFTRDIERGSKKRRSSYEQRKNGQTNQPWIDRLRKLSIDRPNQASSPFSAPRKGLL